MPLAVWGRETVSCASCRANLSVRFAVPPVVLTGIVLTAIYGVIWVVPWEKNRLGVLFLVGVAVVAPFLVSWLLGNVISLQRADEDRKSDR
jgi:prepilin signal peptidase PulO-like enzyme (type II secretory pathway)